MIDLDRVHGLLQVFEKAMGHPNLKPLAQAAMEELNSVAEALAPKPKQVEVPDPKEPTKEPEPKLPLVDNGGRRV